MNTQAEDDDQFKAWCHWHSAKAEARRRTDGKLRRWPTILLVGVVLIALALLAVGRVEAGGTVTDSKYIWLQRSGVTLSATTTPKLACPAPKTVLECSACMISMIEAEVKTRTSGYVTYRCLDVSQSYVKFSKTPVPPIVTPPTATTQVLSCPEAGADGRILESATVQWPNCPGAAFASPSKTLVVAVNTGVQPLYWRLASQVTDRVWARTGTTESWTRIEDINWGTAPTTLASVTLSWTPPTQNTDGTSLTNLAGYRVLYGASPTTLVQLQQVPTGISSTVVENLTEGTWYFAVKAYNTAGIESVNSNIAAKTLP